MSRPFWSGQVQISLVSFGVNLFSATESKSEIRFHQLSRKTGERIRHQKVTGDGESDGASPVEKDEMIRTTQAEVKVFILDTLWQSLPRPPFTDEDAEVLADRVYDYVWQRSSTAGTPFPSASVN